MKSSRIAVPLFTALLVSAAAHAAGVDMKDPRRALGREDDVRVDAQLLQDTVKSNGAIAVNYQVQNLTSQWIAVADRTSDVSYDADSQTIFFSIGAEVPDANKVPHLTAIAPGDKKTFKTGGILHVAVASRGPFTLAPRYVQIKVNILRDAAGFRSLIDSQSAAVTPVAMTNDIFDRWVDSNDTIFLNALPVRWDGSPEKSSVTAADDGRPKDRAAGAW